MRHGVRVARRRCRSDHRRQGPPEAAHHQCYRDAEQVQAPSRDAAAAQPGSHSSSAPGVAPADRDRRQCWSSWLPIYLPASVADAFGDGLFRRVPEASRHQRRHDGNAGHNDPIRNGRDSNRKRCKAHHNHTGNEKQSFGSFGEHETSVATGSTGPLFRIARCPDQSRRLAARTCWTSNP